jgi:hypothetical protein
LSRKKENKKAGVQFLTPINLLLISDNSFLSSYREAQAAVFRQLEDQAQCLDSIPTLKEVTQTVRFEGFIEIKKITCLFSHLSMLSEIKKKK